MKKKEIELVLKQDDDGHWYMIPSDFEKSFNHDSESIEGCLYRDCPDAFDDFTKLWGQCMTGGSSELVPDTYKEMWEHPVIKNQEQ